MPAKPKHVPVRTCVSCRTSGDKRGLLRIVRQPDGVVAYDPSGKSNGRGAYICANEKCIAAAKKQRKFDRCLKASVSEDVFDQLLAVATTPVEDPQI